MMKLVKQIPNFITCLNIFCGFLAIIFSFNSILLVYAPYLIFFAAIIDFLDGFAARMLKAYSLLGKQLDSLADMVSFGLAPGILAFRLVSGSLESGIPDNKFSEYALLLLPALIPVFSALRLAKFNIDENQTHSFTGLATPSSAILIASTLLIVLTNKNIEVQNFILNKITLSLLIIFDCFLMVSKLPMFSLKFKSASFKENWVQYLFIVSAILMFLLLKMYSIPLIVCLYILESFVIYIAKLENF